MVGIFLIARGLHTVLRLYNATEGVEFDLLNFFAATFASTTLTFFIGILVADYQIEDTRRIERLAAPRDTELSETLRELEHDTSITVRLSDGSTAEASVSQVQSLLLEEGIRLLWRKRAFDAKLSYLVPVLSSGGRDPNQNEVMRQAIREFEESRREIVAKIRSLKNASGPPPCPTVFAFV